MKFTKERPTQVGWYWCKKKWHFSENTNLVIINVYKSNPLFKEVDSIYYCGNTYTLDDNLFLEFAGPIPEPES